MALCDKCGKEMELQGIEWYCPACKIHRPIPLREPSKEEYKRLYEEKCIECEDLQSQMRRDKEAEVKLARRDQQLSDNQISLLKTLEDPEMGLSALNKRVRSFELNCGKISTGLATRIKMAEEDIEAITNKARHHKQ